MREGQDHGLSKDPQSDEIKNLLQELTEPGVSLGPEHIRILMNQPFSILRIAMMDYLSAKDAIRVQEQQIIIDNIHREQMKYLERYPHHHSGEDNKDFLMLDSNNNPQIANVLFQKDYKSIWLNNFIINLNSTLANLSVAKSALFLNAATIRIPQVKQKVLHKLNQRKQVFQANINNLNEQVSNMRGQVQMEQEYLSKAKIPRTTNVEDLNLIQRNTIIKELGKTAEQVINSHRDILKLVESMEKEIESWQIKIENTEKQEAAVNALNLTPDGLEKMHDNRQKIMHDEILAIEEAKSRGDLDEVVRIEKELPEKLNKEDLKYIKEVLKVEGLDEKDKDVAEVIDEVNKVLNEADGIQNQMDMISKQLSQILIPAQDYLNHIEIPRESKKVPPASNNSFRP